MKRSTKKLLPLLAVIGLAALLGAAEVAATGDARCLLVRCVVVK